MPSQSLDRKKALHHRQTQSIFKLSYQEHITGQLAVQALKIPELLLELLALADMPLSSQPVRSTALSFAAAVVDSLHLLSLKLSLRILELIIGTI